MNDVKKPSSPAPLYEMHQLIVGPFQCNCSILVHSPSKEALVIDAGDEAPRIIKALQQRGVEKILSLHTHAHLDHIGALDGLNKEFGSSLTIGLHKDDFDLYRNLPMQGKLFGLHYEAPPEVHRLLEDEEAISWAGLKVEAIHTPGHSPGGLCFRFRDGIWGETPFLFSGDTLFRESIGRTDLWGGDFHTLKTSIKERIFTLDSETVVCPGHGPRTSVGHERKENPFI